MMTRPYFYWIIGNVWGVGSLVLSARDTDFGAILSLGAAVVAVLCFVLAWIYSRDEVRQ